MSKPSPFDGGYGILYLSQEELDEAVWDAHSRGHQIAAHGIGNVAIEMILNAYKNAQKRLPRPDARHRIEHCSYCLPPLPKRIIEEGALPHLNSGHLYYFGDAHLKNYGQERLNGEFPFRSLLKGDIYIANGTDAPVLPLDPAPIMYGAIARKTKSGKSCGKAERVSAYEAVKSYTIAGAYFTFDEQKKGTITPGKYADLVVTNIDPTSTKMDEEPERILELKTLRTILGGKSVFIRE
jgi:predicted amidohydrolase YtcJ